MKVDAIPDTKAFVRELADTGKVVGRVHADNKADGTRTKKDDSRSVANTTHEHAVADHSVRLQFTVDKDTGEQLVRVLDPDSGEVIRQFPPEELLHVMKTLRDLKGVLFSTRL